MHSCLEIMFLLIKLFCCHYIQYYKCRLHREFIIFMLHFAMFVFGAGFHPEWIRNENQLQKSVPISAPIFKVDFGADLWTVCHRH